MFSVPKSTITGSGMLRPLNQPAGRELLLCWGLFLSASGTPAKKRTIPHSTFLQSHLRGSPQLGAWGHFDSHQDGIFLFKKLWHL
jgi:hypothetical protein